MLLAACGQGAIEVAHPFYVIPVPDSTMMGLYRCPDGPSEGCAIDGLPRPAVLATGADNTYVVIKRRGGEDGVKRTEYFYFRRPPEARAWGEAIVGPLTQAEFEAAKARKGLPPFSRTFE